MMQPKRALPRRGRPPSPIGSLCLPSDIPGSRSPTLPCLLDVQLPMNLPPLEDSTKRCRRYQSKSYGQSTLFPCLISHRRGRRSSNGSAVVLRCRASVSSIRRRTWEAKKLFAGAASPDIENTSLIVTLRRCMRLPPEKVSLAFGMLGRAEYGPCQANWLRSRSWELVRPRGTKGLFPRFWCLVGGLDHRTGLVDGPW